MTVPLHFETDEYFQDTIRGLKPGHQIKLPTAWGYYSLKVDEKGALRIGMQSISGPTMRMAVMPEVSNFITIEPVQA